MTDLPPILCRECGHDIDYHYLTCWCDNGLDQCDCPLAPSDIARALLTSEPTADEVEAAARALYGDEHRADPASCAAVGVEPCWEQTLHVVRLYHREAARAALQAARKARP